MTQVAQATESAVRHPAGTNTVQTKLASEHNKQQSALITSTVLAEQNDASLVAGAESEVNEAFEVLVRRHQAKIRSVAWRFTRSREDVEDITQQACQKAFVHLPQFQVNSSFSPWLTRIAINEALMWSRKKRGWSEVSLEMLSASNETAKQLDPTDLASNPEQTCLELERKRIVSAAINKLAPGVRRAIQLRQLGELSIEETAALTGLSVATVKARLFRGRWKLRSISNRHLGSAQICAFE